MKISVAEKVRLAGGTMSVGAVPQAPKIDEPERDLKAEIADLKRRVQQLEDHNRMTAHGDLMNMRIG